MAGCFVYRVNNIFLVWFPSIDRSLMLWKVNLSSLDSSVMELNMKDIRTVRAHVQYDSATLIRWSPDSKALLTVRALGNNIEIYKVIKKPEAGGLPSVQPSHAFQKVNTWLHLQFAVRNLDFSLLCQDSWSWSFGHWRGQHRSFLDDLYTQMRTGHSRFERKCNGFRYN